MIFYTDNLNTTELKYGINPWDFKTPENITAQIRKVKDDRHDWATNPATKHMFYTGVEPVAPAARPSKENPPFKLHAIAADYDTPIPDARIDEAIASMPIKPSWIETSLGGNRRLLWLLPTPVVVTSFDFCVFFLQECKEFLKLNLLPALDEPAFENPTRLYAAGTDWRNTGHGPVDKKDLLSFLMKVVRKFKFTPNEVSTVPLNEAWARIQELYPSVEWPGDFVVGSQGPSFWIKDSTSPMSAIVKEEGMITFSAHADKMFYSWAEILGNDFVKDYAKAACAAATDDCYWDGKTYWRKKDGLYTPCTNEEMELYWKKACKVSKKIDKLTGSSQMDDVKFHVMEHQFVEAAASFVYRPAGLIRRGKKRFLNTFSGQVIEPSATKQEWGPNGGFPLISEVLDSIFSDGPDGVQKAWLLSWLQYFYTSARACKPKPGQNIFLMGAVGIGKTLLARYIIGALMGGFTDASSYIVDNDQFTAHLFENGVWCLDDDTPANSPYAVQMMTSKMKKMTANTEFVSNEKFLKKAHLEWIGRMITTANTDSASARILGPMDQSVLDKTTVLACVTKPVMVFPSRDYIESRLVIELPNFARFLMDYARPAFIKDDPRWGIAAIQDKELLNMAHQSSPIAPFKEILIAVLREYFSSKSDVSLWRGTLTDLLKLIASDPMNEFIMRSIKIEQANRYIEQLQKEGTLKVTAETVAGGVRVWTFFRDESPNSSSPMELPPTDNSFQK